MNKNIYHLNRHCADLRYVISKKKNDKISSIFRWQWIRSLVLGPSWINQKEKKSIQVSSAWGMRCQSKKRLRLAKIANGTADDWFNTWNLSKVNETFGNQKKKHQLISGFFNPDLCFALVCFALNIETAIQHQAMQNVFELILFFSPFISFLCSCR